MKNDTSTLTAEDHFTLKEKLLYGAVGLVVIGGSFFIGRSLIRNVRATTEEKRTFEQGSPATIAKQIRMAFENDMPFGWGTNEEALRTAILSIPSKEVLKQVINSYQKLYAQSMMADMQSELTSSEYNELLAIMAAKPDRGMTVASMQLTHEQLSSWAKRLKAAFDMTYWLLPGTDEPAIKAVFTEIPTQAVFWQMAEVYKNLYGSELIKDLKSELEFWEYPGYMNIILQKAKG